MSENSIFSLLPLRPVLNKELEKVIFSTLPFVIYFVFYVALFPWDLLNEPPPPQSVLSWTFIIFTLILTILKRYKEDYYYLWFSLTLFFSLYDLIWLPFILKDYYLYHEPNGFHWICAGLMVILVIIHRIKRLESNKILFPIVAYIFSVGHFRLLTEDFVSFPGVHVDFWDLQPILDRLSIHLPLLFILFVLALVFAKNRKWRIVFTFLFMLSHFLVWNYTRIFAIFYYTGILSLVHSAVAYIYYCIGPHINSFFFRTLLFIPGLCLIPFPSRRKGKKKNDNTSPTDMGEG